MHNNSPTNVQQDKYNDQFYSNQQFEYSNPDSYLSKVQKQFTIAYENLSYEHIELSTNQMRQMMKNVSKLLDDKIHKYYGLMGQKFQKVQNDKQAYIHKLRAQLDTNKKLESSQIVQIKDIELIDEEMASSKRIQKQAQRLKQYFQTKKAMIQSQKQMHFSKGQVTKFGDYLARDLDIDKQHFRLNKIKQQIEYAMLKQSGLIKRVSDLDAKTLETQQKLQNISKTYEIKIRQAQEKGILIQQNTQFYQQYHKKKQLISKLQQVRKNMQVLQYNVQYTYLNLFQEVDLLKKSQQQNSNKVQSLQSSISAIQNQILQTRQKSNVDKKIELNMSIKNIETLLKSKRQKNDSMTRAKSSLSQSLDVIDVRPLTDMTESSIFSKPNFKIKPFKMASDSKMVSKGNNLNKSIDLLGGKSKKQPQVQFQSNVQKRILKWHRASMLKQKNNKNQNQMKKPTRIEPNLNPEHL